MLSVYSGTLAVRPTALAPARKLDIDNGVARSDSDTTIETYCLLSELVLQHCRH